MNFFGRHVQPAFLLLGLVEFLLAMLSILVVDVLATLVGGEAAAWNEWGGQVAPIVFGFAVIVGMLAMGLYQARQRLRFAGIVARQIVGLMVAAMILALLNLIFSVEIQALRWLLASLVCLLLLVFVRLAFDRVVDQTGFRRRVLVLGAGRTASSLLELRRKSDQRGFRIVAFLPAKGDDYRIDDERVNDSVPSLLDFAVAEQVNEIVVAMDDRRQSFPVRELLACRFAGIDIVNIVGFLERETGRVKTELLTPDYMIYSAGHTASAVQDFTLRVLDLVIVAATAVVTLPLMALTAIAILLDDGRPITYKQTRVGYRGREFVLLKFRSMINDAEVEGEARWAEKEDSRITRVGRTIRKYRLDELPQLINVLKGDMSLVGPRPERPEFVEELAREIPYYNERHCVKPGLTGWAQMSYPYGSSLDDARAKLAFDLYFVKHRSLIFNIAVLLQTAEVILWSKGAR